MTNLIVLGNGFDLHCGLKSHFIDFYNNRYFEEIKDREGNPKKIMTDICKVNENQGTSDYEPEFEIEYCGNKISFWDFIFLRPEGKLQV